MSGEVDTTTETEEIPKKNWEVKQVVEENVKGRVKWYNVSKNYGFISRDDDGGDVFVHRSVISRYSRRYPSLRSGEEVQFSVVETSQGIEAYLVTGPEGKPVKGQMFRFPRRNGGRMLRNNEYDEYAPTEQQPDGENGEADQNQPNSHPKGSHRRSGYRSARQSKENSQQQQQTSSNVGVAGDGQDPSEGDSPNQSDQHQRQRLFRRRPPGYRNRNIPPGSGPVSGSSANAMHHQSDEGDENTQRVRRRPRRRRAANGLTAKQGGENGHEVQQAESNHQQANGPRRRGPYRGQRRHNSSSKGKDTATDAVAVESTGAAGQAAVEQLVVATEQCRLEDTAGAVTSSESRQPINTN